MIILYRPVLIESAEQAEALPGGSIVLDHESKWVYTDYFIAARPPLSGLQDDLDRGVHVVALVPIEAEEETHSIQTRGQTTPEWRTRYVTTWEEA